jgi:hypothetical protein
VDIFSDGPACRAAQTSDREVEPSESCTVMVQIAVAKSLQAKALPTFNWCFMARKNDRTCEWKKANVATRKRFHRVRLRVSEILNRKRRLTVEMIRKLATRLNLSANLLIKDYQLSQ